MRSEPLFNNFLTCGVKLATPETLRRIKVLNIFELAFVIVAPCAGLFYYHIHALILAYTCFLAGLLGIFVLLLLRITKNPSTSGNLAVFILWATLVLIRWHTGAMSAEGLG